MLSTTQMLQVHCSNRFSRNTLSFSSPNCCEHRKHGVFNGVGSHGSGQLAQCSCMNSSSPLISPQAHLGGWMCPRNNSKSALPTHLLHIKAPTCFCAAKHPVLPPIQANQAAGQRARSSSMKFSMCGRTWSLPRQKDVALGRAWGDANLGLWRGRGGAGMVPPSDSPSLAAHLSFLSTVLLRLTRLNRDISWSRQTFPFF